MNDIYLNGEPLGVVYDSILTAVCQACAEIALLHECNEECDEYHLYCGECI